MGRSARQRAGHGPGHHVTDVTAAVLPARPVERRMKRLRPRTYGLLPKSTVNVLLDHGVNNDAKTLDGDGPLSLAVMKGKIGMVRILLRAGASNAARNKFGRTPLDQARYKVRQGGLHDQMLLNELFVLLHQSNLPSIRKTQLEKLY